MRLLLLLIFSLTVGNATTMLSAQDSTLFLLGSFLGGASQDRVVGTARDAKGDIFIVGTTESANFPVTAGTFQTEYSGNRDVFLAKFSAEGTLLFASLLGGSELDEVRSITIDALGFPIIAGITYSPDFPATSAFSNGPASEVFNGGAAFVARCAPDGSQMLFAALLGGASRDEANDVIASPDGIIWVAGTTESVDFPVTLFAQQKNSGGKSDGFLAELHPSGDLLAYSTYIGGKADDEISAIALDIAGNVYCGGSTASPDFPGAVAPERSGNDLFAAQYLGGTMPGFMNIFSVQGYNSLSDIVFSPANGGRIYCAGSASWTSLVGIRRGGYRELATGKTDAFVIGMTTSGIVESATFFGGSADDFCTSIATDGNDVVIAGTTYSDVLPATPDAFSLKKYGGRECFVASFDAALQNLKYCSFAGGTDDDEAAEVAIFKGTICLAGTTSSRDFPVTSGGFTTEYGGGASDGFVQIFNPIPLLTITPNPVRFGAVDLGESATIDTLTVKNISLIRATRVDSVLLENDASGAFVLDKFGFFPSFPSGASGRLRVTFKARTEGNAKGSLAIWANGIRYAVELLGQGITPPPQFTADDVVFDTTEVNAQTYDSMRIVNLSNRTFTVDSIIAEGINAGRFAALEKTPFDVPPSGIRFVKVMFFPSEQGRFAQIFRIFARGVSVQAELEGFAKSGMPPPSDSVFITDTDFGNVELFSNANRTVAIKNAVSRAVILDSLVVESDAETTFTILPAAWPIIIFPDDSLVSAVSASPKVLGKKTAKISAYIGGRRFSGNVSANGTLPPVPEISVNDVNFQTVIVNQFRIDSAYIKNSGSAPADIIEVSVSDDLDGDFYITDFAPRSLAGGDSMTIHLKFAPKSSGNKSAKLVINTLDGIHKAMLSGIALPPDSAAISIAHLVFRPTFIDTYRDSSIVLLSVCPIAARIDSARLDGDDAFTFGIATQFPVSVAPGDKIELPVRFAPKNARIYGSRLTIWHRDGMMHGTISGEGILPPDTLFTPRISATLPTHSVAIGQKVDFPLIISGDRRSLDSLHGKQFIAHIRFNANVLAPADGRGTVENAQHTITLSGIAKSDVLGIFHGVAALGDADSTPLQLLDCYFVAADTTVRAEVSLSDGLLRITDIWKYGGPRLVESVAPAPVIVIHPNPIGEEANILLYRVQPGCILQIFDGTGRESARFLPDVNPQTGEAIVRFTHEMARGIYFCRVISGLQTVAKALFSE
ncbi:MAG: choice-of-anchor D domain-containing protein [Bacteroidetes bacterium]|nr:choice-of-anchor D domain-containing protein [Bacteroidota bacterium]MCZ2133535.1 choice-of-anchor D domain-containing protein [Bacteroidota bacterium]